MAGDAPQQSTATLGRSPLVGEAAMGDAVQPRQCACVGDVVEAAPRDGEDLGDEVVGVGAGGPSSRERLQGLVAGVEERSEPLFAVGHVRMLGSDEAGPVGA